MTVTSIITWGITLLGLVAAGVFAITKYMNSNAIRALEDRIRLKDDMIRENKKISIAAELSTQKYLPAKEVAAELNDTDIKSLVSKIEELEKQREQLLSEVSIRAASSLDPRSELSSLLTQLESKDETVRAKAINGLFTLRDPSSFLPLIKFLENHTDEAAGGLNPSIGEWFSFFIDTGGTSGVEFIAAQLESPRPVWSDIAYLKLEYRLNTTQLVDEAIPVLENIALRSTSNLARVKAKVLIQRLQIKRQDISESEERKLQLEERQHSHSYSEGVPHEFVILTVLSRNGLGHLAFNMMAQGHEFKYWRTGFLVVKEFLMKPDLQEKCVSAIRDLVNAGKNMAPNSHGLLLYFLSKMELYRGNNADSKTYLEVCKKEAPETYEYFMKHDDTYDLKYLQGSFLKPLGD